MLLTERERRLLRDLVVRKAAKLRQPNPLVTREEMETEEFDLFPIILDSFMEDPDSWGFASRRFSHRSRILD